MKAFSGTKSSSNEKGGLTDNSLSDKHLNYCKQFLITWELLCHAMGERSYISNSLKMSRQRTKWDNGEIMIYCISQINHQITKSKQWYEKEKPFNRSPFTSHFAELLLSQFYFKEHRMCFDTYKNCSHLIQT